MNIVATGDMGFKVKLNELEYRYLRMRCITYDPEIFPGLMFEMKNPKLLFMIFASGKYNILGARTREMVYEGCEKIIPLLLTCKIS